MKTVDEREIQKTKQNKKQQAKAERSKGNRSYSERVRATWFLIKTIIQRSSSYFQPNI